MGSIYSRLHRLENLREENKFLSSDDIFKSNTNRTASASQAKLIDDMYQATPHLRDVDSLLRRVRGERVIHSFHIINAL
jgi:hypothetical protein